MVWMLSSRIVSPCMLSLNCVNCKLNSPVRCTVWDNNLIRKISVTPKKCFSHISHFGFGDSTRCSTDISVWRRVLCLTYVCVWHRYMWLNLISCSNHTLESYKVINKLHLIRLLIHILLLHAAEFQSLAIHTNHAFIFLLISINVIFYLWCLNMLAHPSI
jgi:hypothetical protein